MEIKIACTGYDITVDWYEGADDSKVLIVLPGYASSKARQKAHAKAMVEATGTSALVVDFSGHGNSPFNIRDTSPAQHFLELVCVYDWIKKHYPELEISISGSSYGGFLAAQLTRYRKLNNVILRAPAIYELSAFYDIWAKRIDNEDAYIAQLKDYRKNTQELLKNPLLMDASSFRGRMLVVTHGMDEVVPSETTDAYIRAFGADSYVAEDFAHIVQENIVGKDLFNEYQSRIARWLTQS